jgi:uncharacterized protein (DUF1684 family)
MTRATTTIAVAALVGLAACGGPRVAMAPVPPPRSWQQDLVDHRKEKDAAFASDPDSPIPKSERATFSGLTYFPADPTWRYAGWLVRYPSPERITMVTTSGQSRPCEKWGKVTLERDGRALTLQVYRLLDLPDRPGGEGLFLPFKDRTSGKDTYAAGRYVDLDGPDGGPFVLDFNRAYNPSCAYGEPERFQCPVTPAENTLPIAVEAGERGPGHGVTEASR